VPLKPEVTQGGLAAVGLKEDATTIPAISTIGSAMGHKLLAAAADCPVTPITSPNVNLNPVNHA